ncbi:MAG: hypothetical protein QM817_34890 [Archangium sp.]
MAKKAPSLEEHLRSRPDDWASWLVFGDALLDQGDVRGELIRLEHQHANARSGQDRVADEIRAFIKQHQPTWHAPLPEGARPQWLHGFIVGLELQWIEGARERLAEFLASPHSRFVTSLAITRIGEELADEEDDYDEEDFDEDGNPIRAALDAKQVTAALGSLLALDLKQLRTLSLAYVGVGEAGAALVAEASGLSHLAQLDLRFNLIGNAGAKSLAASKHLHGLSALHLQSNELEAAGAKALAAAKWTRLEFLDLRRNTIGPAGAKALAASTSLSTLKRLWLQREDVGAAGVTALAKSATLPASIRGLWKGKVEFAAGGDEDDEDED